LFLHIDQEEVQPLKLVTCIKKLKLVTNGTSITC
jgi:hypothetical protein